MSPSASIHPGDAVYAKHWQSAFAAPLCHISFVDIWICHCVSGLQNVFIIGLYYKQRRLVLKNEVKKTTTRPRRPSGPKWTTHRVSAKRVHKGHIRIQANGKQAHRPTLKATQRAACAWFAFRKQRRRCRGVTESAFFFFFFFQRTYVLVRISHRDKHKLCCVDLLILDFKVCFVDAVCVCTWVGGGREEMGIERFQFHINIYRDIFENILELINKVIVALRCFQFRRNSFLFFFFLFFLFRPHNFRLWQITPALGVSLEKSKARYLPVVCLRWGFMRPDKQRCSKRALLHFHERAYADSHLHQRPDLESASHYRSLARKARHQY